VKRTVRSRIAVVGIGNDVAGDDGAGLEAIRLLEPVWQGEECVLLVRLEGDLLAIADLLPLADEFVFVDAVAGSVPGETVRGVKLQRAFAPSFHQTDIATVMRSLEALRLVEPFPRWEIWGVTILPPEQLRQGLSPPVERAVRQLASALDIRLRELFDPAPTA
jgi:hydrogenase maturation protease